MLARASVTRASVAASNCWYWRQVSTSLAARRGAGAAARRCWTRRAHPMLGPDQTVVGHDGVDDERSPAGRARRRKRCSSGPHLFRKRMSIMGWDGPAALAARRRCASVRAVRPVRPGPQHHARTGLASQSTSLRAAARSARKSFSSGTASSSRFSSARRPRRRSAWCFPAPRCRPGRRWRCRCRSGTPRSARRSTRSGAMPISCGSHFAWVAGGRCAAGCAAAPLRRRQRVRDVAPLHEGPQAIAWMTAVADEGLQVHLRPRSLRRPRSAAVHRHGRRGGA